jgi:hypothetical protein
LWRTWNQELSELALVQRTLSLKVLLLVSGSVEAALRPVSEYSVIRAEIVGSMVIIFGMRGWRLLSEMKQGGELAESVVPRTSNLT